MKQKQKVKKHIVSFMGDPTYCQYGFEELEKLGFYPVNTNEKIKEICRYLVKSEEGLTEAVVKKIRFKGYQVNRLYWINLILSSIPDDKNNISISNLMLEDIVENVITTFYIPIETNSLECPKGMILLQKTNSKEEFESRLKKILKIN